MTSHTNADTMWQTVWLSRSRWARTRSEPQGGLEGGGEAEKERVVGMEGGRHLVTENFNQAPPPTHIHTHPLLMIFILNVKSVNSTHMPWWCDEKELSGTGFSWLNAGHGCDFSILVFSPVFYKIQKRPAATWTADLCTFQKRWATLFVGASALVWMLDALIKNHCSEEPQWS
jgi:hypothetical protein